MHGRERSAIVPESEEERRVKLKKIAKYCKLTRKALSKHEKKEYDDEADLLSAKLLEINPDYYTLWNVRKLLVQHRRQGPHELSKLIDTELSLTERALRRNPKSYGAWYHRLWMVTATEAVDELAEVALCTKFLALDALHCWGYRRSIVNRLVAADAYSLQDEYDFTTAKIEENFSNYSAWHHRSVIIPRLYADAEPAALEKVIDAELELVRQAFFTEPRDQSAWLYHRWLIACSAASCAADFPKELPSSFAAWNAGSAPTTTPTSSLIKQVASERHLSVLRNELSSISELLELEPDCKWGLLTTAVLLHGLHSYGQDVGDYEDRQVSIFARLAQLDPLRANYYSDVHARLSSKP